MSAVRPTGLLLAGVVALSACSGSSQGPTSTTLEVTVTGETITPNGARFDAEVGTALTVVIDSDREGELHVHSTPEQEIAFEAGKTTHELVFEQPGVVEIEEHSSDFVVAQVEVR